MDSAAFVLSPRKLSWAPSEGIRKGRAPGEPGRSVGGEVKGAHSCREQSWVSRKGHTRDSRGVGALMGEHRVGAEGTSCWLLGSVGALGSEPQPGKVSGASTA